MVKARGKRRNKTWPEVEVQKKQKQAKQANEMI